MNEAYQNLLNRFSTKKYTDQPVSDEMLDAILEAGLYAPTGKNNQKAIMVAVRDRATRDQLSRMNAEIMGAQLDPFYGAPCVVVVLSDPTRNTWVEDGSLVMGNLMNAATALGLGSCWIHRAKLIFEQEEGKQILADLGIEGDYEGIGHCILGYPDVVELTPAPRKADYIHYIR